MMRRAKLTRQEKAIENALIKGEYVNVDNAEFETIAHAIAIRRRDAVLNVRVNSEDIKRIKEKAKRFGVPYQTLISEFIHRLAHSQS
ncbi:MAG: hypothetical protein HYS56_00535 [Candidatus Omnitrophica bacterium]|nr:hypothetical protein [Candidatus Omnitrophota bacterium]